ncbi:MAG: isochorismatase family cysteine hydrolase [Candidatus Diapherotrites archaeon]
MKGLPVDCAIIVVDMQNDFAKKTGALYVPKGEKTIPVIKELLKTAQSKKALVVFTMDWHEKNDPEFSRDNWPKHCVKNTRGAKIVSELKPFLKNAKIVKTNFYDKFQGSKLEAFLKKKRVKKLFFCGLATEYCVKFTALTAKKLGFEVFIVRNAIKPVNCHCGRAVLRELSGKGIRIIFLKSAKNSI